MNQKHGERGGLSEIVIERADVVVIGSGMAGICAAIQAARLGCSVILLEKDEVLGGNGGPNLGVHISGAHGFHPYASETGIVGEIEEEAAYRCAKTITHDFHYNISRTYESILQHILEEAGVVVHKRHYARDAIVEGRRITAVMVEDLGTFRTKRIEVGVCLIEASGDGHVAAQAGASFRMGRESRHEFGERTAPEEADRITMGTSVTALVRRASHPVPFVPPPGTPPFEPGYGYGQDRIPDDPKKCLYAHSCWRPEAEFCFLWHTETGGQWDTIADDHRIYEELLRQLYSVWNHIKNEAHAEEAANWELVWVSPKAGKRESRRFMGDYILTQADVENGHMFPDAVAYGGYAVDLHDPVGTQVRVVFHSVPPLYGIPFRCLYSKDLDNLLLAGRLISVTHMALGTVRLQKTLGAAGQAVGAAAYLCKKHFCSARGVYEHHIHALQQLLLRHDATILSVRNEDPEDLARSAVVTASSETRFECTEMTDALPMDVTRGIMLWDWGKTVEEVELYLRNETDQDLPVELTLSFYQNAQKWKEGHGGTKPAHVSGPANRMEWGNDTTVERFRPVARTCVVVPADFEGWVRFRFPEPVSLAEKDWTSDEERVLLTLPPVPGIAWARHDRPYDFAVRCWAKEGEVRYRTEPDAHLFRIHPRPPYGEAANVINGWNRRYATNPVNMWISRHGAPLPQQLTLQFEEPRTISRIHLTFDTLYRSYREMPFNDGKRVSGMCVRDYDLEIRDGCAWSTVASVTENYRRFRVHTFPSVAAQKVRLMVHAMNDPAWTARVYEVRVYER